MENPTRIKLGYELWNDCPRIRVDKLPYDIDGLCVFTLSYDANERCKMKSTQDGRTWNTWSSSSRNGFRGICYINLIFLPFFCT